MTIKFYNNRTYANVVGNGLNYWYSVLTNKLLTASQIASLSLAKDDYTISCAKLCVGQSFGCSDDSLLANNYDCLLTNSGDSLTHN